MRQSEECGRGGEEERIWKVKWKNRQWRVKSRRMNVENDEKVETEVWRGWWRVMEEVENIMDRNEMKRMRIRRNWSIWRTRRNRTLEE